MPIDPVAEVLAYGLSSPIDLAVVGPVHGLSFLIVPVAEVLGRVLISRIVRGSVAPVPSISVLNPCPAS